MGQAASSQAGGSSGSGSQASSRPAQQRSAHAGRAGASQQQQRQHAQHTAAHGGAQRAPRGPSPSSPRQSFADALSLAPQVPTTPLPRSIKEKHKSARLPDHASVIGFPGQPALQPAVITWRFDGQHIRVYGSWDKFSTYTELQSTRTAANEQVEKNCVKLLPPGVHEYVFVVDGHKRYAPDQPAVVKEPQGEVLNVLQIVEVETQMQEAEEPPPPSPPESYTCPDPVLDDFSKEPTPIPPQLPMTLLNVSPFPQHPSLLPRPLHVLLNHVYVDKPTYVSGVIALGVTHRYRSKFTSLVIFKPSTASAPRETSAAFSSTNTAAEQQEQQQQAAGTSAAPVAERSSLFDPQQRDVQDEEMLGR